MNQQHRGNLLGGAIGETTQTTAQLATIAASAVQTVARMRARQLEADRGRDQAAADAQRAMLRSEHAAARLAWVPAFERSFLGGATAPEAAAVWAAARPWVDHDPTAHEAARRAEERLALLHPPLIVRYQQGIADGLEPGEAMAAATTVLATDINGAAAARTRACDERAEAQRHSSLPDVPTTISIDEHGQGIPAAAAHAAISDSTNARAALLAAQAYPHPLRGARPHRHNATGPGGAGAWHASPKRPVNPLLGQPGRVFGNGPSESRRLHNLCDGGHAAAKFDAVASAV